jgi:hypothetical protein
MVKGDMSRARRNKKLLKRLQEGRDVYRDARRGNDWAGTLYGSPVWGEGTVLGREWQLRDRIGVLVWEVEPWEFTDEVRMVYPLEPRPSLRTRLQAWEFVLDCIEQYKASRLKVPHE